MRRRFRPLFVFVFTSALCTWTLLQCPCNFLISNIFCLRQSLSFNHGSKPCFRHDLPILVWFEGKVEKAWGLLTLRLIGWIELCFAASRNNSSGIRKYKCLMLSCFLGTTTNGLLHHTLHTFCQLMFELCFEEKGVHSPEMLNLVMQAICFSSG